MSETMAVKLAPDPDMDPEDKDPLMILDPNEEVIPWESVFIDPEVDSHITIEGIPISEIAKEVQSVPNQNPVLSYEDILFTFGFSEDVYTPENHERLLMQVLFGTQDQIFLTDSLQKNIRQRPLLQKGDFSSPLICRLSHYGFPTREPDFHLALGNLAAKDAEQASHDSQSILLNYAFGDGNSDLSHEDLFANQTLGFMVALAQDVDSDRVDKTEQALIQAGCANLERDKTCTLEGTKIKPEEYQTLMTKPECRYFEQDIQCVHTTLFNLVSTMGEQIGEAGLNEYRHQAKGNTFTTFGRALYLRNAIGIAAFTNPDIFQNPPENILIIGPGLEEIHPDFDVNVPRQSYEPFAVAEAAIHLHADPEKIHVDLADISLRVVEHFKKIIDAAKHGSPHRFYLSQEVEDPSRGMPKIDFANNLPGTKIILPEEKVLEKGIVVKVIEVSPKVVSRFDAAEGDIITDYLAPAESYDWVVIMNTFDYFDDAEKMLAMENITRLLKPGGILFTDLDPNYVTQNSSDKCGTPWSNSLRRRIIRLPQEYRPLILYIK